MSREERRALNQHMHRKHPGMPPLTGDTIDRLVQHEELHKKHPARWDHTHEDYTLPAEWREAVTRG